MIEYTWLGYNNISY